MSKLTKITMMLFCALVMMSCSSNRKVNSVEVTEPNKEEKEQSIEDNINWEMNLIRAFR